MHFRAVPLCLAIFLAGCLLAGCSPHPLQSAYNTQLPPANMDIKVQADPAVWGVYTRLVGHRFEPPQSGFPGYEISWSQAGQEIRETARYLKGNSVGPDVMFSRTIRPGARQGQLVSNLYGAEWVGTIQPDGSVLFLRTDGVAPYRIGLSPAGEYLHQIVETTPQGQVKEVLFSTPYAVVQDSSTALDAGTASQALPPSVSPAPQSESMDPIASSPTTSPIPANDAETINAALTAATEVAKASTDQSPAQSDEALAQGNSQPAVAHDEVARGGLTRAESADQDAQVAALMAQHKALVSELGIEDEVNAKAAEMLAQIEQESATNRAPSEAGDEAPEEPAEKTATVATNSTPPQAGEITRTVNGVDYRVGEALPEAIKGKYLYEGEGQPIVFIADGQMQSQFQPHGDPEIPITAWIVKGPDGKDLKEMGINDRYQVTLVIQYGAGGGGNYPQGSYDLLPVVVAEDMGKAFILGERIKNLP